SNNTEVAIVDGNGVIKGLKGGSATITVSFDGNERYAPAENKTIIVTVKLRDASVSVNNDTLDLTVDDTFELVATTVPSGLNVTYTTSNASIVTVDANGKVTAKAKGSAIITASVGGDGVYVLNSTNVGVTVNEKPIPPKKNLTIEATAKPITVGQNSNVIVTGFKDAAGNVTVTIGSNKWAGKINKGTANIVVTGLKESVIASVNYPGDDKYNSASTTVKITVNPKPKENLTISATAEPITVGDNANVIVTGLKDATGNVAVIVNGKTYTGSIKNSEAKVIVPGLTETVTGNVNYPGDDKYNPASTTVKITVNPNVIIYAPDVTKYYGGSERFAVTLKDLNGKPIDNANIKITINGQTYTKTTDNNGETSIALNLNSGVYNVTTEYNGTKVYSTVTVKDTVIAKDVTKIFRNGTQYQGTFVDSEGNLIKNTDIRININGVFYTRTTDANGMAQMNINLPPGTYILTAINPSSSEQHTTIVTVLLNIVENYDVTKYYKNASQYSLRLLDDKGNPVGAGVSIQLNINGVFYTRTSDANGYVKMNINLPPGTYIITAEYKGLRMSNTIKVLTVLEAKDLVMKYHDGSQFKVKVLDGQGRPYAGQTVTYNINGVFYTKTTDGDGIAALTINLPAGEYIITSMYNGLNSANKVTISG
ncbi:Ig-like domain-containing protein, partial [uncultured Methanobrevibacter sp.]|uniref:Ig-like domain-containing protein n=1 Tax=uncultured Methanobrevibacter sp. TaxID=253161 RepID=UPI0025EFD363